MAEDAAEESSRFASTNRRRFVTGAAAIGAAGVAGCYHGDPDGPGETSPTTTSGGGGTPTPIPEGVAVHGLPINAALMEGAYTAESEDQILDIGVSGGGPDAKNANWNPWGQQGAAPGAQFMFTPQGVFNRRTGRVHYYLFEEVTGGVDHVDLVVRDGIAWHNGDPVTAEDIWAGQHFNFVTSRFFETKDYLPNPLAGDKYLELLEDESTVRIHLESPRRAQFLSLEFLIGGWDRANRFTYDQVSDYIDRARDALDDGDGEALDEVHKDFVGAGRRDAFRISDDEVLFNGPYMLKERQSNGVLLERNPEFPRTAFVEDGEEALNFETIRGQALRNPQAQWKALTDDEIQYAGTQFSQVLVEGRPDKIKFESYGTWRGMGLNFDHAHPDFKHREVRQAMAYVSGQEQVVLNQGETWAEAGGRPDGIRVGDGRWLGDLDDELRDYSPTESDTEAAAERLRAAEYTKEDGTWVRPNGDPFEFRFIVRGDHQNLGKTLTQQWTDFGLTVEQETVSGFQGYQSAVQEQEWGLGINWIWMFRPHPWFAYNHAMVSEWIPKQMNYLGWNPENGYDGGDQPAESGFTVEVPEIGSWDGPTTEIDVKDVHTKLGDPSSDIGEKEAVQTLAWVYNVDLPKVPVITQKNGKFYNTQGQDGTWSVAGH